MRCFFHAHLPPVGDDLALAEREARHLFGILRGRPGDRVLLIDGQGTCAEAEIRDGKALRIVRRQTLPPPPRRVHLLVAPPRHQKMDQLLAQCAEVGVWRITPVSTAREVAKAGRDDIPERWRLHLAEGCKQAHNPFLPEIVPAIPLAEALAATANHAERWYGAVPADGEPSPAEPLPATLADGDIAWLVGPEGGFTPAEDSAIRQANFRPLQLGRWILRVETAAILGAALLAHPDGLDRNLHPQHPRT
jgi:16S rRNA (uracil1498-N3)-methyltransferase